MLLEFQSEEFEIYRIHANGDKLNGCNNVENLTIKNDEIVDLNGAGDAFLGGFLAMYLKVNTGNRLFSCCKAGNDAASVILRNVGCTYPKNLKLNLDDQC